MPDHDVAGLLRRAVPGLRLRRRVRIAVPARGGAALDESAILNPQDKPRLAAEFCAEHGLTLEDAIAYGDSMSDVFLFDAVGVRVSVNGDHHLAERSDIAVEGTDLLVAYRAARELCDRAAR